MIMRRRHIPVVSLGICTLAMVSGARAQQPPATKILVAGENPAITLRDKEGGAALTSVNFWRVHWSPVGSGAVCFVTVSGQGSASQRGASQGGGDLRIALYDNAKVLDYVTKELMSSLQTSFNTPPYTPVRGTIAQSGDTVNERKETCTSDTHTIELVWRGFSEPTWVDIKPGANVLMTFTMVMASGADVIINGQKAPGGVFRGGPGSFPPSFLALNETWRR